MTPRAAAACLAAAVLLGGAPPPAAANPEAQETAAANPEARQRALSRYCVTCHNERVGTAGLLLDQVDVEQVARDPDVWEKVVRKLRTGLMPPDGRPRPDAATYASLVAHLETELDRAAEAAPNPGWPAQVHRLNRAEYTNAVRDLLGLEVDGRALLPADDSGYGFDNIGDVLTVSPGLMSRYMSAAAKVSRRAVGDPTLRPGATMYKTSPLLLQEGRMSEDLPFGSRGGMAVRHHFPLDGEYVFRISLERPLNQPSASNGPLNQPVAGTDTQLEFRLEHGLIKLFDFDTDEYRRAGSGAGVGGLLDVRIPVKAGDTARQRRVHRLARPQHPVRRAPRRTRPVASFQYSRVPINPIVFSIQVVGPYHGKSSAWRGGRRAQAGQTIFRVPSGTAGGRGALTRGRSLSNLARRRLPPAVTGADVDPLCCVGRTRPATRTAGSTPASSGRWKRCWSRPEFLLRVERHPEHVAAGDAVSDLRHRPRIAAVVLPVEQHPGRRAAGAGRRRAGCANPPCWSGRCCGCSTTRAPAR